MKKAQRKDFFMEIKKSLNRYLSILFIVALGVAFFSGVRSSEPDMRLSADAVADAGNFMDIRILSAMGFTKEDLEAVRRIPGITAAEGERSLDAVWNHGEKELVLHVSSLPGEISRVAVKEGRLPEKPGECFLDEQLLQMTDCKIGDRITLASGTDKALSDTLKRDTYTVVGIGTSPYYLNFDRGSTSIGNGDIKGFLMIPEEDFSLDIYTQIYGTADSLDGYVTADEEYKTAVKKYVEAIEAIAGDRCRVRLAQVKEEAMEGVEDAEEELADRESEADRELSDAWAKIEEGEQALSEGRAEIGENEKKLSEGRAEIAENEKKLSEGRAEIAENEKKLSEGWALYEEKKGELRSAEDSLEEAKRQYEEGKAQTEAARARLDSGRAALSAKEQELSAGWSDYEEGAAAAAEAERILREREAELEAFKAELEAAGLNPEENEQYLQERELVSRGNLQLQEKLIYLEGVKAALAKGQAQYDQGMEELAQKEQELRSAEASLSGAGAGIEQGEAELASGRDGLEVLRSGLETGEEELKAAKRQVEEGEEALADARAALSDGEAQLSNAKDILSDREKELSNGKASYEEGRKEADEKLSDGKKEIEDAKKEIEELEEPEWYVLDRQSVQSYVEFDHDADRIGAIGKVFPVIFFLVAALVSLTTMTRMVEEKRTEIGTMKALGYSTLSIASKYLLYALSASLLGSVLGFLVGEKLLPWVIITAYKILYGNLNVVRIPYNWGYALGASGIAVVCTVGATLAACYKATLSQPAALMRPVAPAKGKKIFLERIRPVWKHMNFSQKSTLRNLFRYKKRLLMTVFGIGACMALLIVGFGIRDSIYAVSDIQYGELWRYDAMVGIEDSADEGERNRFREGMDGDENVAESMGAYTAVMDGEADGVTKSVNLVVPESPEAFSDFFILRDRVTKEGYTLDHEGAVVNEKFAKLLNLKEGDSFYLKESDTSRVLVKVSHITENYVYNYVYLSPGLYEKLYGRPAVDNTEYLRFVKRDPEAEQALAARVLKYEGVSGISLVSDMNRTILDMLGSLDTVVWVLIISAGLLAFVVLYNLNNINITERKRELATIKLLGFYDMELAAYVYRENVLLTLIGIAAGVFMGNLLHRFVIETVEVDLIMFGRVVHPVSYLWGIGLTFLFAFLVNVTMFYKLRRIDMVESLKSVE